MVTIGSGDRAQHRGVWSGVDSAESWQRWRDSCGFDGVKHRWTHQEIVAYPLVNKQLDPENPLFPMETSLPTPMTARVYVNLPEGNYEEFKLNEHADLINKHGGMMGYE